MEVGGLAFALTVEERARAVRIVHEVGPVVHVAGADSRIRGTRVLINLACRRIVAR